MASAAWTFRKLEPGYHPPYAGCEFDTSIGCGVLEHLNPVLDRLWPLKVIGKYIFILLGGRISFTEVIPGQFETGFGSRCEVLVGSEIRRACRG